MKRRHTSFRWWLQLGNDCPTTMRSVGPRIRGEGRCGLSLSACVSGQLSPHAVPAWNEKMARTKGVPTRFSCAAAESTGRAGGGAVYLNARLRSVNRNTARNLETSNKQNRRGQGRHDLKD